MPIYEYFCQNCEHEFEEIVFGSELPTCPKCQTKECQKLISRPSKRRNAAAGCGSDETSSAVQTQAPKSKCSGCSGGNCASC